MGRSYDFTETSETIRGMFWFPGSESEPFHGVLHLEAGESARLETAQFNSHGLLNLFPGARTKKGEQLKLMGKAVMKAMSAPGKKMIYGHDEHGEPITLLDCHSSKSKSTFAMASHEYTCKAAIFGRHFDDDSLKFDKIRLHFDHFNRWFGRCAFSNYEDYEIEGEKRKLSKIIVPIAQNLEIPLDLEGYSDSQVYCGWYQRKGYDQLAFHSRVFLDLCFEGTKAWPDVIQEIQTWQWFFSLGARSTVDLVSVSLYKDDKRIPMGSHPMEACPVWLKRRQAPTVLDEKRSDYDFHFSFSDIEVNASSVIAAWQRIQKPWAAVLHRFFAISGPRSLWINEEFLFLAQAIESLFRARNGLKESKVNFDQAAKEAHMKAPDELREMLGERKAFVDCLRKSRNYWTHYGEPGPESDAEILDGEELWQFNEKLRYLVESAILQEIQIPDACVAKVWSSKWQSYAVEYE